MRLHQGCNVCLCQEKHMANGTFLQSSDVFIIWGRGHGNDIPHPHVTSCVTHMRHDIIPCNDVACNPTEIKCPDVRTAQNNILTHNIHPDTVPQERDLAPSNGRTAYCTLIFLPNRWKMYCKQYSPLKRLPKIYTNGINILNCNYLYRKVPRH